MYVHQGRNLNGIIVFSEELFPVTLIAWLCWDVRVRWDMLRPKSSSFYIANFFQGKIGPNSASNADHSSTAILLPWMRNPLPTIACQLSYLRLNDFSF
jgi:hypothetical protein